MSSGDEHLGTSSGGSTAHTDSHGLSEAAGGSDQNDQSSVSNNANQSSGGSNVDLNTVLHSILTRLSVLESSRQVGANDAPNTSPRVANSGSGDGHPGPTSNDSTYSASRDIQGEFATIRDALQRVKIPPDLRLNDSNKQGIRRQDHVVANILIRNARYTETIFKLLSQCTLSTPDIQTEVRDCLDAIFTVCLADIRYLQEEYAALIVQSTFDQVTTRMFKSLQKNNSALSPGQIKILQSAASISAAASHRPYSDRETPEFSSNRRRQFQQRGRNGRFNSNFSRGGYQHVGHSYNPNDNFSNLSTRNIPLSPRQPGHNNRGDNSTS